ASPVFRAANPTPRAILSESVSTAQSVGVRWIPDAAGRSVGTRGSAASTWRSGPLQEVAMLWATPLRRASVTVVSAVAMTILPSGRHAAAADQRPALAPRTLFAKPARTQLEAWHSRDTLFVKFQDDAVITASNSKLADRGSGALT